jgi:hypothetical protein
MLKRVLLGLLVLWSGVSLLAEARRAISSWDARDGWETRAEDWRPGSPPVARLEACLAGARRLVPGRSVVAFAASGEPPGPAQFYVRWAAYLMPAHNVFWRGDPAAAGAAPRYVLSWRKPLAGPELGKLQLLRQLPGCFLYQASPP